jgi:tRNA(Ile)-lysidine synthase
VERDADQLLAAVVASGLLPPERPVIVLLSGGRDSVCLLDVAVRAAGGDAVTAMHVNYGLRPEAAGDQRHCEQLCESLGLELLVQRPAPPRRGNLQAWARDARYGAAAREALRRRARVAVGHTATDQAETVLYRLAASPGRRALLGMPARDGMLVRPLLEFTRAETAAYCRARGLAWRDDPSNQDADSYTRARARHRLVPALRDLHPAAERNVVRTAQLLRDEAAVLDAAVGEVLQGHDHIAADRLAALPPALRRLVLRRLAEDAAGELAPAAAGRADELMALAQQPEGGALDLGGGLRAVAEGGRLRFAAGPPPQPPEAVALPVPGMVRFGDWEVTCEPAAPRAEPDVLDAATLGGGALVRAWRPGDRMSPLGLGGSKTLADLFGARGVPRERRRGLPVVECGGEIAWVPGVATGERFRVGPATTSAVHLIARARR